MANIKILVCAHKRDYFVKEDPFMPIQVGKALSDIDLGITGDDTGDNISLKNAGYCELTAIYWAWKNLKDADYIGLNHYRRYFKFEKCGLRDRQIVTLKDFLSRDYKLSIDPDALLKNGEIILARPMTFPYNIFLKYSFCHVSDDMRMLEEVVHEISPEYDAAFRKVIRYNNRLSFYNMFICRRDIFDDYCSWLFKILGTLEGRLNIEHYNPVQKRIYGYMAEKLLNVYVEKHKLKKRFFPIYWISEEEQNDSLLHYLFTRIRYALAFQIMKPRRAILRDKRSQG
jgi:hypothetical protein